MALDDLTRGLSLAATRRTPARPVLSRPQARREDPLRRRILRATAGSLLLVIIGVALLIEADLRRTAEQAEVATNAASTIARQVERALGPTLITMAAVQDELRAGAHDEESLRNRLRALLARAVDDQNVVIGYGVTDLEGRIIATSTGRISPGTSVAGRSTFQPILAAPPGRIAVSAPAVGAVGMSQGRPIFSVGRRLDGPPGGPEAAIATSISIPYITDMLALIEVLGQGTAELLSLEGLRLATSLNASAPNTLPEGSVPGPAGEVGWALAATQGRVALTRGPDGNPVLMAWQRLEQLPLVVRVVMPGAGAWLGLSKGGVATLAFAALLCGVLILAGRLLMMEASKREAVEAASAARLAVLAQLASQLQDVLQVRHALELLVAAVQQLVPSGDVLAVLMPEDGEEVVVHGRKPAAGPAGRAMEVSAARGASRPGWLTAPLRGDAGEYIGAIEVFGCDPAAVAPEDHAALQQVAALGEAALRRGRLLMHLSATAADAEAARAELEQICDTIHDGFCALDRSGHFTYANPAAARLLDPAGRPLGGRALCDVVPAAAGPLGAALAAAAPHEREVALPDGRVALLRLVPTGKGFALFLRDMTIAREAEQLRQTAERLEAVGVLTGGVAHDFNNLLTVVIGNAEALVDALEDKPELAHSAGLILGAAERGAALIRRMMAFARRQPLSPIPTNVAALVEELAPLLQRSVGERVRLVLRLAPGLPPALVDPAQLEATLLNLVINARDAMPRGGTVRIELVSQVLDAAALADFKEAAPGRFLRLSVTDDGAGMTPEVAQRAFEPFFTTKSRGAGSGLGLASVYGFIRQSRGCIALETAPGRGTSVTLHLPETAAGEDRPAAPEPDLLPGAATTTLHVLLVEDEAALRGQIAGMLREMGHAVTVAERGEGALAALREGLRPDVLLSDVVLPGGMDGAAVMREAQAMQPGLPVILMSGFAAGLYDAHGALPKGLRLLEKPFRRQDLARRLEAVMEARADQGPTGVSSG